MRAVDHAKSVLSIAVITLNLAFWIVLVLLASAVKALPGGDGGVADRWLDGIYRAAVAVDDAWLRGVMGIRWSRPPTGLARDEVSVVIANHASWADILLLQSVVTSPGGPLLKFLAKRELLFVPIVGVICWAYDMPLLRRRSRAGEDDAARRRADAEALREACASVRAQPAALMSFAEGTRFTPEKMRAAGSPYRALLPPRVGGLSALLDALEGSVRSVVDVTIVYPGEASFWRFLAGRVPDVTIEAERVPIEALPGDREGRRAWLEARWAAKDRRIEAVRGAGVGADGATER